MRLHHVLTFAGLTLSLTTLAHATVPTDIRTIQSDSTDVFQVLQILKEAERAHDNRAYEEARQAFENVLLHDPNLTRARDGLRQTLIALGDIEAAQNFMTETNPTDNVIIRIRLGTVENPDDLLKETLKTDPDPRLWTLLGQLQDMRADFSAARQSYAMAGLAGARPGLTENNIGQSHWLAGEYDLALTAFTNAVARDPLDIQFDNNRRRALIHLGQTQAAISGLNAERAELFLIQAADKAVTENEIKLARTLYKKSLDISPRYNPKTVEKLAQLEH